MKSNGYSKLQLPEFRGAAAYGPAERPTVPIDTLVLFVVVTLVMLGLIVVYAATLHRGMSFLFSQGIRAAIGLVVLLISSQFPHPALGGKLRWLLLIGSVVLLVVTLGLGFALGDAKRWLGNDNFSIQPAELGKLVLLIWLAGWFARQKELGRERSFRYSLLIPGLVVLVVVGLTLAQPAIGTSFIMAASALAMFFIAGVRLRYVLLTVGVVVVIFVLAITCIDYPRQRWQKFVSGESYHQEQSLIAIGSGGPVGKGLGEGKQKFFFLPKMHNDFIFAEIGEEFGFIGSLVVYLLYGLLFLRGMRISRECSGQFGQNLAAGIAIMLFLYAIVHVAVTLGRIPTTGQPLPFVSYGGSALVTNLLAAGILLNISRYKRNSALAADMPWQHKAPGFATGGAIKPRPRIQLSAGAGFTGGGTAPGVARARWGQGAGIGGRKA